MSIKTELQKERKELLLLRSDVHIEHTQLNSDHPIGTHSDCKTCQLYRKIQNSEELVINKLQIILKDDLLIGEFNQLRRRLDRIPKESEFKQSDEVIERFGSWDNFLMKIKTEIR